LKLLSRDGRELKNSIDRLTEWTQTTPWWIYYCKSSYWREKLWDSSRIFSGSSIWWNSNPSFDLGGSFVMHHDVQVKITAISW